MVNKEYFVKKLEKDFMKQAWYLKGCSFFTKSFHTADVVLFCCEFESRLDYIRVVVSLDNYKHEKEFANREFRGEQCLRESLEWTAEQMLALYGMVRDRFREYKEEERRRKQYLEQVI